MLFAQTVLFQGRVTDSLGGAINGALVTVTGAELTPRSRHVSYTFAY